MQNVDGIQRQVKSHYCVVNKLTGVFVMPHLW